MKVMLDVQHVRREFQLADGSTFTALGDINMQIYEGQLTILKGRSGSGKTTLLNLLGAMDVPTKGDIFFSNGNDTAVNQAASSSSESSKDIVVPKRNIARMSDNERTLLRRKDMGFVFQTVALIPLMTAYENVEYALRLANIRKGGKERAIQCLEYMGMAKRMKHMPEEMSGGEQQRVGIARAIAHHPKIIFADEPTGALDTGTGLQVIKMLKDMIDKEGVTIVMTTHDPGIMAFGDRGYELEDGEIIGQW